MLVHHFSSTLSVLRSCSNAAFRGRRCTLSWRTSPQWILKIWNICQMISGATLGYVMQVRLPGAAGRGIIGSPGGLIPNRELLFTNHNQVRARWNYVVNKIFLQCAKRDGSRWIVLVLSLLLRPHDLVPPRDESQLAFSNALTRRFHGGHKTISDFHPTNTWDQIV